MKGRNRLCGLLAASMIAIGCSENATGPEETVTDLSATEQMTMVASEVAEVDGGLMSDLKMASANSTGSYAPLGKSAGFDTTLTKNWVTYKLSLKFFNERGVEQSRYIVGVTDSITYQSTLSGSRSDNARGGSINLQSGAALNATDVKSGTLLVNGTGANNSTYGFAGQNRQLSVAAASFYRVNNVAINVKSGYVPISGTVDGTIKGTFTVTGGKNGSTKDYSFTFKLTFNGNNQVTVTLPNGKPFTLNLVTGQFN